MIDKPASPRIDLPKAVVPDAARPSTPDFAQKVTDLRARMEARQEAKPANRLGVAGLRAGEAVAEAKGKEGLALGLRFAADYWKLKSTQH